MAVDHQTFRAQALEGKIRIGVEPAVARKLFTDLSASYVYTKIGESIPFERATVRTVFFAGLATLTLSFFYAVQAFGWWATVVIPFSAIVWFVHGGSASMGRPRLWWMTLLLLGLILLLFSEPSAINRWLFSIVGTMYLDRIKYRTAVFFVRALVIRNEKAYEFLANALMIEEA